MRELLTEKFEQPTEVDSDDNMYWLNDLGQLHRDGDKPAIIWADGGRRWYKNGELHRDGDKPAVISASGTKLWYKNGELQYTLFYRKI